MAVNAPEIVVCGCGPGASEYLSDAVREAASRAEVLVASRRLQELFPESNAARVTVGADVELALQEMERQRYRRIVVLVSGDPGLCSFAQPVIRRFGAAACRVIPGVSSVQVAFARLGLDWLEARVLSTHNGLPDVPLEQLKAFQKIAVLGGRKDSAAWIAGLAERLGADYRCFACENLTLADERVRELTVAELRTAELASLSLVVIVEKELLA